LGTSGGVGRAAAGRAGRARIAVGAAAAIAANKYQRHCGRQQQRTIARLHQRVVVVELGDELVVPPVVSEPVVPEGELVLPELELPMLPLDPELEPLLPGPPMELVLPLPLGDEPLLLVSVLLLPLLPAPAVLGLVGEVLLDELVEPVPPPAPASRLLQALNESAPTTAKVAAAHCVRDIFIRNS
jgi:hypothetical protein